MGFEKRVPDLSRVQSVSLDVGSTAPYDNFNGQVLTMDTPAELTAAADFHRSIVERKDELDGMELSGLYEQTESSLEVQTEGWTSVRLHYTLQNGDVMTRKYYVPVTQELLSDPDTPAARLNALLNEPGLAEELYFVDQAEGDVLINGVVSAYDPENGYSTDIPVDSAGLDELLSAVKADLADGGLGRRYLLDDADRLERCYTNDLILTFRRAGPFARTDGDNTYTICITLQTTATRTLAALAEYGVPPECLLTQAQAQLGNP